MGTILALQPWDSGSHAAVRASIERHALMEWRFETMAGRSPRWRLRHAGLAFAERLSEAPIREVDAVFATSMMSLSDFRAASPAFLRNRPHILYMHENQVAYPASPSASDSDRTRDAHLAFTNLASIEAADRVVWNSGWNRESFVDGVQDLLSHAPERVGLGWIDRLREKSVIVPPPVERSTGRGEGVLHNRGRGGYAEPADVLVAWPHRWEYDKGCEELLAIADRAFALERQGGPRLRWCLLGRQGSHRPEPMATFCERHADRIRHAGWIANHETYRATLRQCDWILSTSRHEFFGIAVAEALLEGCLPWLPRRLSYPELIPEEAFDLDPWTTPGARSRTDEQRDRIARVQAGVRAKLSSAVAEHAVERLEGEVRRAIEASRLGVSGDSGAR